jgi:hypothetical protein
VVKSGKQVAVELVVHDTKSMIGRIMRDRISHRAPDHEVVPRHKERYGFTVDSWINAINGYLAVIDRVRA